MIDQSDNLAGLKIYSTLSNSKEFFKPIDPGKIRMYVCGMTVYDYCHIGHARVLVAFDVITRFLRSQGWDVTYVRNITDIDDKIIRRADENDELYHQLTDRFIDAMHEDEQTLSVIPPDIEPRATAHIQDIIDMVQILIEKGFAYHADNGDVYYRVGRFDGYGKLSNKNSEELLAGARIEVEGSKEDPRDFALWKSAKADEVHWPSPWGDGRPGWHIECSAMTKHCLGDTFDIHGGGPDLPFPHHENEIAQSEAANGCQFVNYWMHAGAVRVDGEKMSKSLGNFFTIRDVLKKYHPEVVRYLLISSHYRSPINYSEDNLVEARNGLERFYKALRPYSATAPASIDEIQKSSFYTRFVSAMNDDFNSRIALAAMYDLVRELNSSSGEQADKLAAELKALGGIVGVLQENPERFLQSGSEIDEAYILQQIDARVAAKKSKNFSEADKIREELLAKGVVLEDSRAGTTWRIESQAVL